MSAEISLFEIVKDHHERTRGSYFVWWLHAAEFGYQVGCDASGWKGVVLHREGRAVFSLDNAAHETLIDDQDVGAWQDITPLHCLELIQAELEQRLGAPAIQVDEQRQILLF